MKTIYLLRHAKSGWSDSETDDFDRTLTEDGQIGAVQIGNYISEQKILPDIVLCSAAARAQETFSYIRPFLPENQAIEILDTLYLASAEMLFEHISRVPESTGSVLIVAHNPGLHELSIELGGRENIGTSQVLNQVLQRFPSGAFVTIEAAIEQWGNVREDINQAESTLTGFVCPATLPALDT